MVILFYIIAISVIKKKVVTSFCKIDDVGLSDDGPDEVDTSHPVFILVKEDLPKQRVNVIGTNILVSVGTITVIALDRYFTIVHAHDGTSRTRVVCSIICVWLLSLVATLPICFYQVGYLKLNQCQ